MPKTPRSQRVPELDGLRGIAILLVVLFHYFVQHVQTRVGGPAAYLIKYLSLSWVGVDIFFVLSGFLVGGILMDQRGTPGYFRVFYLRRALRIFPPYLLFLALLAATIVWWQFKPGTELGWLMTDNFPFWSYALYLQNFLMAGEGRFGPNFTAITWSLAIEEQFYLLFPLLVHRCPRRWLPRVLGVLVLAAPLTRVALFFGMSGGEVAGFVLLPARWDSLLLGALAAWIVREPAVFAWVSERWHRARLCLVVAVVVVVVFPLVGFTQLSFKMALLGHLWIAVTAALLLVLLASGRLGYTCAVLRNRVLRFFGKISYTLYLFHQAALGLVFLIVFGGDPVIATATHWAAVLSALGLTVLFAQLTWVLFERRLIQRGHGFSYGARTVTG